MIFFHCLFSILQHTYALFLAEYPPDFTLLNQNGSPVTFSDITLNNSGPIVVFFIPNVSSKATLWEFNAIQQYLKNFSAINSTVLLVTTSSVEENAHLVTEYNFNFTLLSDSDNSLIRSWSVPKGLNKSFHRTTYVFTPDGYLSFICKRTFYPGLHASRAFKHAKKLVHNRCSNSSSDTSDFHLNTPETMILDSLLNTSLTQLDLSIGDRTDDS